jgi:hypothetical protein
VLLEVAQLGTPYWRGDVFAISTVRWSGILPIPADIHTDEREGVDDGCFSHRPVLA